MFRLRARLLMSALSDAKRELLAKKYEVTPESIEALVPLDPSRNTSMIEWLVKWDKKGQIDSSIKYALNEFQKLKNSPAFTGSKDLNSYTPEALSALFKRKERHKLKDLSDKEIEKQLFEKGLPGARLVLNKEPWKVWRVTEPRYAMILGSNTSWCTANSGYAISYCNKGPLIVIYRSGKPYAQGHVSAEGSYTILDTKDTAFRFTSEVLEMLNAISSVPEAKLFLRKVLRQGLGEGENIDAKVIDSAKELSLEFADIQSITNLLAVEPEWEAGWEWVFDEAPRMIESVFSAIPSSIDPGRIPSWVIEEGAPLVEGTPEWLAWYMVSVGKVEEGLRNLHDGAVIPETLLPVVTKIALALPLNELPNFILKFREDSATSILLSYVAHHKLDLKQMYRDSPPGAWRRFLQNIPEIQGEVFKSVIDKINQPHTLLTLAPFLLAGTKVKVGPNMEDGIEPPAQGTIRYARSQDEYVEGNSYLYYVDWDNGRTTQSIYRTCPMYLEAVPLATKITPGVKSSSELDKVVKSALKSAIEKNPLPTLGQLQVGQVMVPGPHWDGERLHNTTEFTIQVVDPSDNTVRLSDGRWYTYNVDSKRFGCLPADWVAALNQQPEQKSKQSE